MSDITSAARLLWTLALLLVWACQVQAQTITPVDIEAEVSVGEPATLTIWNRPIVTLRAQIGSVTPEHRVEMQRDRIAEIPHDLLLGEVGTKLTSIGRLQGYFVLVEDRITIALLPEDVEPESGQTLEALATTTASRLQEVLRARYEQRRLPVLIRGVILSVAATVLFLGAVWLIGRLRHRALHGRAATTTRPLMVRGLDLRPYLRSLEHGLIRLTALASWLAVTYLWLTFVLLLFPYTKPWGDGLGEWVTGLLLDLAKGAAEAVPGFFTVLVIFLATRVISQACDAFFRSVESGRLRVDWLEAETARATRRLAVALIWIFALTVAYPHIPGSESDAFKGVSVFLGLMVSLGSAGFVNQLMSGLVIVYSRTFKPGDLVRVGGKEGRITEIGLLSTKLVTATRLEVTVPNAVAVGSEVTNFSRLATTEGGSIVSTTVTIGYDAPWRQVHAMLLLAAERTEGILEEPPPRVLQEALSDFYVQYELLFEIDSDRRRRVVLSDLHANIQDVFNEHGVQIMSPHFENQPEPQVVVPPASWYAAPAPPPSRPGAPSLPERAHDTGGGR